MKPWLTHLQAMWGGWTAVQRICIAAAALLCVAAVAGVGAWSMQSQYVPVASDLSPTTAAEVVASLESAGIQSKLNFSGSSVLVPKQDLSKARLAASKHLDINNDSQQKLDGSIWDDPSLHHARLLRQLEQRLARSIGQFEFVRNATVHLSKPEPSPFIRDRVPPSASVVVELRGNSAIARQDAVAIVALVTHSVEGMTADQVTVMDTQGRILSSKEPVDGNVAGQLEYRRRMETDLAVKAESLLSQMLGTGHAVVRVTAELNFNERQVEKKTYDPEGKVKTQETVESESHSTGSKNSAPAAGVGGNSPAPAAATASNGGGMDKTERSTTQYANPETTEKNREAPGKLLRLTVAAVVQMPEKADGAKNAPVIDVKQVESLIKQAVGFDETRSDQISVVTATLAGALPPEPVIAGVPWDKYEQLARSASLGLAAMVAFLLGFLTLRRFRPTVTVDTGSADSDAASVATST